VRVVAGEERGESLVTIAFGRQPWDWKVARYHVIRTNECTYQRRMVSEMSFDEYIRWRVEEDRHLQKDFVYARHGNQLVDFVGKIENLSDDFDHVCKRIGIDAKLPHENASKHDAWRSYYTDETAALIAEAYAPDIEAFGYTFE